MTYNHNTSLFLSLFPAQIVQTVKYPSTEVRRKKTTTHSFPLICHAQKGARAKETPPVPPLLHIFLCHKVRQFLFLLLLFFLFPFNCALAGHVWGVSRPPHHRPATGMKLTFPKKASQTANKLVAAARGETAGRARLCPFASKTFLHASFFFIEMAYTQSTRRRHALYEGCYGSSCSSLSFNRRLGSCHVQLFVYYQHNTTTAECSSFNQKTWDEFLCSFSCFWSASGTLGTS